MSLRSRPRATSNRTITEILSVDPAVGAAAGAETIRINCSRLRATPTVTIGGNSATVTGSSYGLSSSYVDVTTPAHAEGAVDVVVSGYHGSDTASAAFTYQGEAGGPTLSFASDWGTGTGTGDSATGDGGKWNLTNQSSVGTEPADKRSVVATTGLDFPAGMDNCLRIRNPSTNWAQYYWNNIAEGWSIPASNGDWIYFRFYFRYNMATVGSALHPIQFGGIGDSHNTAFKFSAGTDGPNGTPTSDQISFYFFRASAHQWYAPLLDKNETYRVELGMQRASANTWTPHLRIYDSSNVLLAGDSGWECWGWDASHTLDGWGGTITITDDELDGFMFGFPNQQGTDDANQFIYYGGFAVSTDTWCGPYIAGEAD
jgi:hypothetical protein